MIDVAIKGLAAWRLASILVDEDGPFNVVHELRKATGIEYRDDGAIVSPNWNPLTCVWCTSIWTAIVVHFLPDIVRKVLAISAIACLIDEGRSSL